MLLRDRSGIVNDCIYCASLFFYSFTAPAGSDGTTTGRVASPRSIMVHHCFRSKKARRARKQNIDYAKLHLSHCWLPAKVMYPGNSTMHFSSLTRSNPFFLPKNAQIYTLY